MEQTFVRSEHKSSAEAVPVWRLHWSALNATPRTSMVIDTVSKAVLNPLREQRIAMFDALHLP
ncbi:hypothetical protein GRAN_5055 [Granulicella sibirica]|uniref:Uncharacterized protein n=1 Tax=Granulicella sibirica TaxID=2479048 RepID=A0A4Q0SYI5_9BACT|nr:hypothetical protein GRAN_5055 [Granulicella sibirica]